MIFFISNNILYTQFVLYYLTEEILEIKKL